jgi:hypothetical protein
MPSASAMFCTSTRDAWCGTAARRRGILRRSSSISATSAVSMAVSVPGRAHREADVGTGQRRRVVDAVADHADLPFAGRALRSMAASLSSGSRLPRASSMPTWSAMAGRCAGCRRSASASDTQRVQFGDGLAAAGRARCRPRRTAPVRTSGSTSTTAVLPFALQALSVFHCAGEQAQFLDQAVVADVIGWPVDDAAHAAAGQCLEVASPRAAPRRRSLPAARRWPRHRMVGAAGQAGGQLQRCVRPGRSPSGKVGLHRLAVGDGAGLVQAPASAARPCFQIDAALDQDAAPGRRGQAADDGDRRRDHQAQGQAITSSTSAL